jgi:hypothetical protein
MGPPHAQGSITTAKGGRNTQNQSLRLAEPTTQYGRSLPDRKKMGSVHQAIHYTGRSASFTGSLRFEDSMGGLDLPALRSYINATHDQIAKLPSVGLPRPNPIYRRR